MNVKDINLYNLCVKQYRLITRVFTMSVSNCFGGAQTYVPNLPIVFSFCICKYRILAGIYFNITKKFFFKRIRGNFVCKAQFSRKLFKITFTADCQHLRAKIHRNVFSNGQSVCGKAKLALNQ